MYQKLPTIGLVGKDASHIRSGVCARMERAKQVNNDTYYALFGHIPAPNVMKLRSCFVSSVPLDNLLRFNNTARHVWNNGTQWFGDTIMIHVMC